jgi:hypothetical protein
MRQAGKVGRDFLANGKLERSRAAREDYWS